MSKIEEYLKTVEKGSKKTYRSHLNTFFKTIKANPETYISPDKEEKDYADDIIYFLIKRKIMAPKTNNVSKSAILSFLEENDIEIGRKHRKRINKKIKGKRAITRDLPFSKKDIKLFLPHVKPHIRAVILIAISSGMRIDEILKLKNNLIDFDKKPVTICLTKDMTKNHEARTVFISDEAKEALESYLKTKPQHIKYMKKSNLVKATLKEPYDNELIFQFSYENVRKSLYRALNKVGLDTLDPTTNRHQKHIHSFRKYFKKQLSSTMNSDCLNQLTGHESELDKAYTQWEEPELAEEYLKNMEQVTIYGSPSNYTETTEKIKNQNVIIEELKAKIESYDKHIIEFENWKSVQGEFQKNYSNYLVEKNIKLKDKFNLPPDKLIKALTGYSGKELKEFKISMKQHQEKQITQDQKSADELLKLIKEYVQSEIKKQKQK